MQISNDRLNALMAVAQFGNFSRASRALGVTQSALSQRVQKLEEELELTLIIRDQSRCRLTESGERLLRHCQQVQELENEVLQELQGANEEVRGSLRIAGYSSVMRSLIIPSLKQMVEKNPNLNVTVFSREISDILAILRRGEADYVLLNQELQIDGIVGHKLGVEENVHIVPVRGPYPDRFLDHDPEDPTTFLFLKLQGMCTNGIQRSYFDDVYGIIDAVRNGLGQAIVSKHLVLKEQKIAVKRHRKRMQDPIYLYHPKAAFYSRKHALLLEALKASVPRLLDEARL